MYTISRFVAQGSKMWAATGADGLIESVGRFFSEGRAGTE